MIESEIKNVAIIGAGKMGSGIGVDFARFGYNVVLQDLYDEALKYAMESIREYLDLMVETEIMTIDEAADSYGRISTTNNLADAVKDIHHVVEAVPEDLTLKQISEKVGIPEEQLKPFLEKIIKEGFVKKDKNKYSLIKKK